MFLAAQTRAALRLNEEKDSPRSDGVLNYLPALCPCADFFVDVRALRAPTSANTVATFLTFLYSGERRSRVDTD